MKRIFLFLIVMLAAVAGMTAQNPIRWRMSVSMTSATEGTLTLRALVEPGWHLYGTSLPADGPRPTEFAFASKGVEMEGPVKASRPALVKADPLFGMELSWWDANVEFSRSFRLTEPQGASISVTANYMGCNDITCLPPKSQTLTYNFK